MVFARTCVLKAIKGEHRTVVADWERDGTLTDRNRQSVLAGAHSSLWRWEGTSGWQHLVHALRRELEDV